MRASSETRGSVLMDSRVSWFVTGDHTSRVWLLGLLRNSRDGSFRFLHNLTTVDDIILYWVIGHEEDQRVRETPIVSRVDSLTRKHSWEYLVITVEIGRASCRGCAETHVLTLSV